MCAAIGVWIKSKHLGQPVGIDGFECEIDCIWLQPPLAAGSGCVQRSGLYSLDYRNLSNKHVFVAKTFSTAKCFATVCTNERDPAFPLVLLSQSPRENKAASHVLQTVWSYKDLRNALTKEGWNKSHFQVYGCVVEHTNTHAFIHIHVQVFTHTHAHTYN